MVVRDVECDAKNRREEPLHPKLHRPRNACRFWRAPSLERRRCRPARYRRTRGVLIAILANGASTSLTLYSWSQCNQQLLSLSLYSPAVVFSPFCRAPIYRSILPTSTLFPVLISPAWPSIVHLSAMHSCMDSRISHTGETVCDVQPLPAAADTRFAWVPPFSPSRSQFFSQWATRQHDQLASCAC